MGEMADDFLDDVMEMEDRRLDYHGGKISQEEAYDLGIVDEMGFEYSPFQHISADGKICRCCGKPGLHWDTHQGKWRLFDKSGLHHCPVNPLQ